MPLVRYTPQKFNIAAEKWWLEDYFPIGKAYFQGLVKLWGGIHSLKLTANSPLKIGLKCPKRKLHRTEEKTSIFRCKLAAIFREGKHQDLKSRSGKLTYQ